MTCCLESYRKMKCRVVLPDGNVRKLDCQASTVADLYTAVKDRLSSCLELGQSFMIHYLDDEFKEFFSLEQDSDIHDLMSIKIVLTNVVQAESGGGAVPPGNSGDQACEAAEESSSSRNQTIACYTLPKFDADLTLMLQKGTGVCTHGEKSRILTRLCADLFENYSAYPSTSDLETVAKAFIDHYPNMKDTGTGGKCYDSWTNSLVFKMGNYRAEMRKRGSLEMSLHSGKRSRYQPDLPSARTGFKKAKGGVINWQPEYPDGEDEKSLQQHKADIRSEMEKGSPDETLVKKKMSLTFALRRKEINQNMRISDIKDNWPALFDMQAMETDVVQKRAATLKGVMIYLGTDMNKLCSNMQDADCDETLPPAFILQRSNTCYSLCVEQCTILSKVKTFTEAVLAFFICHYVFNLEYGKEYKMAFLFIQVFLAGISEKGMPAKLLSLGLKLDRASK